MGLLNRLAVLLGFLNRQAASKNETIPEPHLLLTYEGIPFFEFYLQCRFAKAA